MGNVKFALKMLKLEFKKTAFYAFTVILSVCIVFLFFNYSKNTTLADSYQSMLVSFSDILTGLMLVFAMLATCFANSIYLSKKINEIAIQTLSGASIMGVTAYLTTQNAVVGLISLPVGILLGCAFNPLINSYIFSATGITGNIFYVSSQTILTTTAFLFLQLLVITVVNVGFAYRNDILVLINYDRASRQAKPLSNLQMPIIFSWIMAALPFLLTYKHFPDDPMEYVVYVVLSFFGIYGLFGRGFPKILEMFQKAFNITKPLSLIATGNIKYSITKTKTLALIIIGALGMISGLLVVNFNDPKNLSLIFISYIAIVLLLTIMILYKIMLETESHIKVFRSLIKLGFTKKKIKTVIFKETFYYYLLLFVMITIYVAPPLLIYASRGLIPTSFAITLIALYTISIVVSGICAYINYITVMFKGGN